MRVSLGGHCVSSFLRIWKLCGSRDAPDLRAFRPVPEAIVRRVD